MLNLGNVGAAAAMQVGTRSVLNPLLWLSAIATPTFTAGAVVASGPLVVIFGTLAAAPPVVALAAYIYFMFKDPDRLQSEPFRIEQQWVQARIVDNRTREELTVPVDLRSVGENTAVIEERRG